MPATRHLATALGALALAAAGAVAWVSAQPPAAPDAAYTRLDGSAGRIGQLRGKVVLVNFWATTCTSCVQEMPQIVATHRKYADRGFETLAVAMQYDPPAYVVDFTTSRQLPFTVVIDNVGAVARAFGDVQLTPTTLLIDRQGRIVHRVVGIPDFAALHRLIDDLVADA